MKRLLLFAVTVAGTAFFTSCEKENEITSLDGTVWWERSESGSEEHGTEGWSEIRLMFTDTHAAYIRTNDAGNNESFTGTYTFDPPVVIITSKNLTMTGSPPTGTIVWERDMHHKGTIRGQTMEIGIETPGQTMFVFLEKR